jgi:hypothetical protein
VRADAGFGYRPVLEMLEARLAQYTVVARTTRSVKHALRSLRYEQMNAHWEIAEFQHRANDWPHAGVAWWRGGGSKRPIRSRLC